MIAMCCSQQNERTEVYCMHFLSKSTLVSFAQVTSDGFLVVRDVRDLGVTQWEGTNLKTLANRKVKESADVPRLLPQLSRLHPSHGRPRGVG
jgi:hypothetical protein